MKVAIDGNTMIPDVLRSLPHLREVLDGYGLSGCGGPLGPPETLEFFARAHGVDLEQLLSELRAQAQRQVKAVALPMASKPALADRLYKRFFFAGILAVLTAGAGWGAYILWNIAKNASFTSTSIFSINAHGQAQIYGWVGLFILGFAYHAFPRFLQTRLQWEGLAAATFVLMLAGILLRSTFEPRPAPFAAVTGATLETAAVFGFVAVIWRTLATAESRQQLPFLYIRAATFWFAIGSVVDLFHTSRLVTATSREVVVAQVATFQAALRDLQIHGVAMIMIFGVALRLFPSVFQFPEPRWNWARPLFWPLNFGIAAESLGLVLFMNTKNPIWAALSGLGVLAVALSALAVAASLRVFRRPGAWDRSHKFFRASHLWLGLSLVMLVTSPIYFKLTGQGFSHAWYGAARHAITVGFVSLTIMGVAARVIPTLAGLDPNRLGSLAVPFTLVNLGCSLRVAGQVATDFHANAFAFAGVSGLLELTGLALWGVPLAWVLLGKVQPQPLAKLARLDPDAPVAAILESFPQAEEKLKSLGFALVSQAFFRHTLARTVTLRQACALRGKNLEEVLRYLEEG